MAREDDLLKYYSVPPEADLISMPATYTPVSPEERKRRVAELNQQVKENVQRIQNSTEFRNFLIAMSRFHNYSWNNQMLIWLQKPGATHVAGFNTWHDLGRYVKGGEKGIAILAPLGPASATTWTRVTDGAIYSIKRSDRGWAIYDDKENLVEDGFKYYSEAGRKLKEMGFVEHKEMLTVNNFKAVHIFDISQTEGKPLPEFEVPSLTGEANSAFFVDLLDLCKEQNITVSFAPMPSQDPSIKGSYNPPNSIWVRPEEAPAQQLKTLLHELSHHYTATVFGLPRADAETIAESSAYIVGAHYGFDSGVRSFPYVALWAKDEKILYANMKSVQEVAEKVIDALEQRKTRLFPMTQSLKRGITPLNLELFYPMKELMKMARNAGINPYGMSKRTLIRALHKKGIIK